MSADKPSYPLRFDVDYPARLNRLTTGFRPLWLIPIFIVLAAVTARTGGRYAAWAGAEINPPYRVRKGVAEWMT